MMGDRGGNARVGVLADAAADGDSARALAERLGLPCSSEPRDDATHLLAWRCGRLEARWNRPRAPGPVWVDPAAALRRAGGRRSALARAIGVDRGIERVVDATAGLGRDALALAAAGCHVLAVERHPVIAALLQDGLRRAAEDPVLAARLGLGGGGAGPDRIRLVVADAASVLARMDPRAASREDVGAPGREAGDRPPRSGARAPCRGEREGTTRRTPAGPAPPRGAGDRCALEGPGSGRRPDAVLLDPMFPARTKSARVKKEMQLFHELVGTGGEDAGALLALARRAARRRVAVKRSRHAPPLSDDVDFRVGGTRVRFDVYLTGA